MAIPDRAYVRWLIEDQCKALLHMTDEEIASALGVSRPTLSAKRKDYGSFSIGDIEKIEHRLESIKAMILSTERSTNERSYE